MSARNAVLMERLIIVALLITLSAVDSAFAQENMRFDSEAKKLEFIREMLQKEEHLRLWELSPCHCSKMMEDLLTGKGFQAIEPSIRAESKDDPRLAKWNQCRDRDYKEFNLDPRLFFSWLPELGDPPYRYYRVEFDGNLENGPEDVIYHETPRTPSYATTGYTWVDLQNCEIKGGYTVTGSMSQFSRKANAVYLNTLVTYQDKLWVLDFVDGLEFRIFRRVDPDRDEICKWRLSRPQ